MSSQSPDTLARECFGCLGAVALFLVSCWGLSYCGTAPSAPSPEINPPKGTTVWTDGTSAAYWLGFEKGADLGDYSFEKSVSFSTTDRWAKMLFPHDAQAQQDYRIGVRNGIKSRGGKVTTF